MDVRGAGHQFSGDCGSGAAERVEVGGGVAGAGSRSGVTHTQTQTCTQTHKHRHTLIHREPQRYTHRLTDGRQAHTGTDTHTHTHPPAVGSWLMKFHTRWLHSFQVPWGNC